MNLPDRSARTSVIIPCYKHDEFLREALASVENQTQTVLEVLVVDDGSPEPLQRPIDWKGPNLRWIRTGNQGLGAARNTGIRLASGEFLAFCDADDWWQPTKIEMQQQKLDEHPESVACYTWCVDAEGYFPFGPYPSPHIPRDELAVLLWNGQFFPPSSVMMRRESALRVGGFREGLRNGEDLDMWFRLFTQGEIVGVTERLCWYRIHEKQITQNAVRKILGAKEARKGILTQHSDRLLRGGIASTSLWNAYRNEIYCTYYRRQFSEARVLLWDFLKENPKDLRSAIYLFLSCLPAGLISAIRGKI
jgi:glycosyltransferase involved in cell wall biosynthesis